jgi:hypothetical protein
MAEINSKFVFVWGIRATNFFFFFVFFFLFLFWNFFREKKNDTIEYFFSRKKNIQV